ncbi:putative sam and ph domain-containing protein [Rosellinia necatrix]|uniref:Putative sam and ph domain-containing protein n=1 Tax=Rosellinia necatrix TaxID=77044 RepID=A0A1W2TD85_ROSNE|nr:putative sam and ph domain-containing protein [Rosellinia necatrix]
MNAQMLSMGGRSHYAMQRNRLHDPYFGLKQAEYRPMSVTTEIVDTDWDEDEDEMVSEIDDDDNDDANSPRVSLNSTGQQSAATLSSYDEAQTPRSSRIREAYAYNFDSARPVEGPRGPHLFRSSTTSSDPCDYQDILSLSPITPKTAKPYDADFRQPFLPEPLPRSRGSPYQFTDEKLDPVQLSIWSPEKVAQWMLNAGIEPLVAEKFVMNDINGAILITLKFEDLRELDIQSFGVRTKIWEEIHALRNPKKMSPRPETPIEDEESREVRRERRRVDKEQNARLESSESCQPPKSAKRSHNRRYPGREDMISPLDSVSIVGIEQMIPEPHHCSKGENCKTHRKRQRMIEAFKRDHPFVDVDKGGIILVAGDPGNPETAPALNRPSPTDALRPMSDAVPSVVASSDVLGPGMTPFRYLQEAALRNLQTQDPQDNVRQFLDFQHQQTGVATGEVPQTPPFELHPGRTPHGGLRALPRLSIPVQRPAAQGQPQQMRPSNLRDEFIPYRMDRAEAVSPDLTTPVAPYRFGTPFSDMDVPITAVPLGPIARDASQSVPPDMGYRAAPISRSRASHRPSLQIMAPVEEDVCSPTMQNHNVATAPRRRPSLSPRSYSPTKAGSPPKIPSRPQNPLQAPPRLNFPWSQAHQLSGASNDSAGKDTEGVSYQGPVKKRKTRMLRHEWHDQYAILKGTRLALHKDADNRDRTLEYIDIDDYAIACSSLSTTSKLNAAFKAMNITRGHKKSSSTTSDDIAAFSFQLIPQEPEGGRRGVTSRLRRRESQSISGPVTGGLEGSVNSTGKTHHFAVRSRDERIDWMRELMLAKALKQKGEGFEVSVNGNMI